MCMCIDERRVKRRRRKLRFLILMVKGIVGYNDGCFLLRRKDDWQFCLIFFKLFSPFFFCF